MKDTSVAVSILAGLTLAAILSSGQRAGCPRGCACEVRAWFSPSSLRTDAPTVDCSRLGLSSVPEGLPLHTQVLLLHTNNIGRVQPLGQLANITEIDISQNHLSSMGDLDLGRLPGLLSLHMEENWLGGLPNGCLAEMRGLQELYVDHNRLSFIAPGGFLGLRSLVRLHLNSNRLQRISSLWFRATPRLEVLMLGENPIARIEDMTFQPLASLRSLVLAGMNLSKVPDGALAGLERLESLSFYGNSFARVPHAALKQAQSLRFLDLNRNPIERIQKGDLADLLQLRELGVSGMPELVSIDSFALSNLPELTKIEATDNPRLSYVHPNAFHALPRLETLMLHGNALSALHRATVGSLPSLREVSVHGNPLRCDCVARWMGGAAPGVRLVEPEALLCAEPPEVRGQPVRRVPFREMSETCLPLIAPRSLPSRVRAPNGGSVSLHCRAFAEPEPHIYWITPAGGRVLPNTSRGRYRLHPEGTLDIRGVSEREAGLHTCVAHNLLGADLRSVEVEVDGYVPRGPGGALNPSVSAVRHSSALVSWETGHSGPALAVRWWPVGPVAGRPAEALTARVPSDVRAFNLTQLDPSTRYQVCVGVLGERGVECVGVTTAGLALVPRGRGRWGGVAAVAVSAALLVALSAACSLAQSSRRTRHALRGSGKPPAEKLSPGPGARSGRSLGRTGVGGQHLPIATETKATVIDVPNSSF